MVKLIIKNPDGSLYWRESFNDRESCDKWLAEEQTRPYWNPGFTVEVDDKTKEAQEAAEQEKKKLLDRAKAQEDIRSELKDLRKKKTRTAAENQAILEKVLDLLEI